MRPPEGEPLVAPDQPPPPPYYPDSSSYQHRPEAGPYQQHRDVTPDNKTGRVIYVTPQAGQFPAQDGHTGQSGERVIYVVTQPISAPAAGAQKSYAGYIILSCCVFWCCCWIMGLVAFVLAVLASSHSSNGRTSKAQSLGKASLWTSIAGAVIGTIIIVVVVFVEMNAAKTGNNNYGS